MTDTIRRFLLILPAILVYAYLATTLNMIQDDAFISYRYVANYLNGHGLVFNIGELIEGYTNFGWVIFLSMLGVLKIDYVIVSQFVGALFGAGIIVVTYYTAEHLLSDNRRWLALIPTYLVGANMSLAYWSPAGLETAAFGFFAALSVYLFVKRSWLLVWTMLMAVWLRPEGAFVVGLLIVCEAVVYRRLPKYTLVCAAIAFMTSLPYVFFKLGYYGSILPNPFYAKTGFDITQLSNGIEYTWRFLQHYGFWGAGIAASLLVLRNLPRSARFVWLFTVLYMAYILLIGGDVLKVHRFFVPIMGGVAIVVMLAIWGLSSRLAPKTVALVAVVVTIPLLVLTVTLPKNFVFEYNRLEQALVRKMKFISSNLKHIDKSDFSVALSTIGAFSYELVGHRVIDMLGLTDSTIARHSEEPIPGMESTWKEAKHNSAYLLTSNPDYIVFSTGIKPSAPAELALFLYPEFIRGFYMIGFWYKPVGELNGTTQTVFKRRMRIEGRPTATYAVEYVQAYKLGLEHYAKGDWRGAIPNLVEAIRLSPAECHAMPLYRIATCASLSGNFERAERLMDSSLALDSFNYEAHRDLMFFAMSDGNIAKAQHHHAWIMETFPWYWRRIEEKLDTDSQVPWRPLLGLPER